MDKFALFINNNFVDIRDLKERPADIPHKNIKWYPLGESIEGQSPGWQVIDDKAVRIVNNTVPPRMIGTFTEFMDLFTPEKQVEILNASKSNPILELTIIKTTAQNSVDLNSPKIQEAFTPLIQLGIVSANQIMEIKTNGF